ncbi:hypothetical protein PO909_031800 [Leuciscus waleckii]
MAREIRNMYDGMTFVEYPEESAEQRKKRGKKEKKRYREQQLERHPDIVFRCVKEARLSCLVFRSTNEGFWMRILREFYRNISVQWNYKHEDKKYILSLSGDETELNRFCDEFRENLHVDVEVREEVDVLNAGIADLQLEGAH